MPAKSQAQRGYLAHKFGAAWMRKHHFDNKGKLPDRVGGPPTSSPDRAGSSSSAPFGGKGAPPFGARRKKKGGKVSASEARKRGDQLAQIIRGAH